MKNFSQTQQDCVIVHDQNPNYLKSRSKYLKSKASYSLSDITNKVVEQLIPLKNQKENFENELTQAKIKRDPEKIKQLSNTLSKLYEKQGNYKDAYKMQLVFKQMTDSLQKKETEKIAQQQLFNEQQLRDSLKNQQQQNTYQQSINTKNKEVENSHKTIYITSIALLIVTVLSFFLYKSYHATKSSNKIISAQKKETEFKNIQIEKALQDKELLLKEVHHRVKNNLQIVSSLLNLQANKNDNADVKKIMNEATQRINSMALIHQKIYQSGNLSSIDFQGYIEQITQTIEATFNSNKTSIKYIINTNNIELSMDIAIPLGLIINELLTNCYKYAFLNKAKGIITIILQQKENNELQLHVADDGIGLPEAFNSSNHKSLGLKLVKGLAGQLKGVFTYHTNNGAHFFIDFKNDVAS